MRNMPRVYTSFMPNAPILNGVPGAMLDVIKKCLIGGWTPFDILKIDVSNGIATISMSATSYSLPDYCRLMISDCDEPQLNKEWTITRGGNTAAQFETTVADGTYGGAIKAVPEPAGWELVFSGTNEAIIRSANQDSSRTIVKIVDQNATTCGFDFALDAKSINELIDNARAIDNVERNILKSKNADPSHYRGWYLVCDNSTVYYVTDMFTTGGSAVHKREHLLGGRLGFFGDYISNSKQETEAFAAYFQNIATGATGNNLTYANASLQWSGQWTEDWNAARPVIRLNNSGYSKWYWCNFNCSTEPVNPVWRINGTTSAIDIGYVSNLENTFRKVPVYGRVSGPGSAVTCFGHLPGYRYSDYHIRAIFMPFTSGKDEEGNVYLYTPVDSSQRDDNNYNDLFGMAVFVMNRKWGE